MSSRPRLLFRGTVQGVGFRATTQRAAHAVGVRGWVRNLPDGSVEALAEGSPAQLDRLIGELRDAFGGGLAEVQREPALTPAGAPPLEGFLIRR